MSVILGRWPLIPENHCTTTLPNGIIGTQISDINAPNAFCERRLQIELTKIAFDLLTSDHGKPSSDPVIIDKHIRRLKEEFIYKLPPSFGLHAADEKWDDELPNLKRQREMLRISVFVTMCSLLRPVIIQSPGEAHSLSASDRKLVAAHRASLIDVTIEMLESVGRLHLLMGGKHNRFFLLSFFTLEPAVLLGMCLVNPEAGKKEDRQSSSVSLGNLSADEYQWKRGRKIMAEAVARLRMLSEVSSIARTGVKVLEKLVASINSKGSVSLVNGTKAQHTRPASTTSSRSSVSNPSDSQPRILVSLEDLPVASTPNMTRATTASDYRSTPIMPPHSQHVHPSQDSQLLYGITSTISGSVCDLDARNTTPNLTEWGLDFGDVFLFDDSTSPNNAADASNAASEFIVSPTNVDHQQSADSYAPSYADTAWALYPTNWAWDALADTANPALFTPYDHAQFFAEKNAPMAMDQTLDWGLMGDQQVMDFGQ